MPDQPSPDVELLHAAYVAFNARDIDGALATMAPDVAWPKAFKGGFARGHQEVRAYWTEQWSEIDPRVLERSVVLCMWKRKRLAVLLGLAFAAYLASYLVLSRRGYAEADRYHSEGFFYSQPEESGAWKIRHYGCVFLFWPLSTLDQFLGTGRGPCLSEPMMGLSRYQPVTKSDCRVGTAVYPRLM